MKRDFLSSSRNPKTGEGSFRGKRKKGIIHVLSFSAKEQASPKTSAPYVWFLEEKGEERGPSITEKSKLKKKGRKGRTLPLRGEEKERKELSVPGQGNRTSIKNAEGKLLSEHEKRRIPRR